MQTLELFSGTGSFSQIALKRGHEIATFDLADHADELAEGTHTKRDILDESAIYPNAEMLWASPPCEGFSVAAIGRNWDKETRAPKSPSARLGVAILKRTLALIAELKPRKWYIENPRGMMRKIIPDILNASGLAWRQVTVTYCQYGDSRMKPTDIWTNDMDWQPKPPCRNGDTCHVAAPRGSKTGTQGIKGARERSRIPAEIFDEILDHDESPRKIGGLFG